MGGSEPILTLFEFRNPYGKMDRPLDEKCNDSLAWVLWGPKRPRTRKPAYSLRASKYDRRTIFFQKVSVLVGNT